MFYFNYTVPVNTTHNEKRPPIICPLEGATMPFLVLPTRELCDNKNMPTRDAPIAIILIPIAVYIIGSLLAGVSWQRLVVRFLVRCRSLIERMLKRTL